MSNRLLEIDVSNLKSKIDDEEEIIELQMKNGEKLKINFYQLFIQSKYLLNKYKYCEALMIIQIEITKLECEKNINSVSIRYFNQLLQEEKVKIPIEYYKDIYALSEYFHIPKFLQQLDNINERELFTDLEFSIQTLLYYKTINKEMETKLTHQLEEYLSTRINECIQKTNFIELPISSIYRIIERSDKKQIDQNLFLSFILKKAEIHFILFKFVELHKMTDDNIDLFIKFIEEQQENNKIKFLEYIPFDYFLIKKMKTQIDSMTIKINTIQQELDETKQEFNQTKQEYNDIKQDFDQTKQEFNQTKQEYNDIKQDFDQTKQKYNDIKQDFDQTKQEYNDIKQEFNQTKVNLDDLKNELDKYKKNFNQENDESNQAKIKTKQHAQYLLVAGIDNYNQLGEKPNNEKTSIISPPLKLPLDPSSLLSYSVFDRHSVLVTSDGSLLGIGDNRNGRISSSLTKTEISQFTEFSINDDKGQPLTPISAFCSKNGTLYMFSKNNSSGRQLVYCDGGINGGDPIFLDIGDEEPVALFGGCYHTASISKEGKIIFINYYSVKKSPKSRITAVSLPDGEKASSVACCNESVIVLSLNDRVFTSPVQSGNSSLNFSAVSELSGEEIISISGIFNYFLAVSKGGRVFGLGSNYYGQLGLGKETGSVSSFTEISSLKGYKIKAAYAGFFHSFFVTGEGKIFSCGQNNNGQLLLSSDYSKSNFYSPIETTITSDESFFITGNCLTAAFVGGEPPPNTPNKRILYHQ